MSYTSRKTKPPRPRWWSFPIKSSRPSWFGKSGRPQNITNIQVFERVSEWNKFVDIDILGQHSSIKWVWWRLFYLFGVLQTNESINCPQAPTLATFKKSKLMLHHSLFQWPVFGKHLQFSRPKNSSEDHSYQFSAVQDTFQEIFVWKRLAGQNGIHHGLRNDSEIFWDLTAALGILPAGQNDEMI